MESLNDIDLTSLQNDNENIRLLQSSAKEFIKQIKIMHSYFHGILWMIA